MQNFFILLLQPYYYSILLLRQKWYFMIDYLTDIAHCIRILENGGLILYPTDTVWGIGCDATNETAVAKINALKQRTITY